MDAVGARNPAGRVEDPRDRMVGCMVGTSLSMAPAMLLTPQARFIDLERTTLIFTEEVPIIA